MFREGYWESGRLGAADTATTQDYLLGQGDWYVSVRGDKRDLLEVALPGQKATLLLPFSDDVVVEITEEAVIIDASEGSVASAFIKPPTKDEIPEAAGGEELA